MHFTKVFDCFVLLVLVYTSFHVLLGLVFGVFGGLGTPAYSYMLSLSLPCLSGLIEDRLCIALLSQLPCVV